MYGARGRFAVQESGMGWLGWALLSAVFAAATAILAKIGIKGIDSNLATAIRTTVVLVFTWAIAIALEKHNGIGEISQRSWLFLVLSGIATGLSWLCYFRALQLGPASAVAPIDKLSVVIVIVAAWLVLGESLTPMKMLGGGLIAAGAVVLALA
jgi:transporter family protein